MRSLKVKPVEQTVFVDEIDSGSKSIEGVAVNTAAFIGYAKSGEFNKPTFITNWTQFCEAFGEEENALTAALVKELGMTVAEVRAAKKASRKSWMAFSLSMIDKAVREKKSTVKGFQDFLKQNNIPQGGLPYMEGSYLAHAVSGYYQNGDGRCYVIRIAHPDDIKALAVTSDGKKGDVTETFPGGAEDKPLMLDTAADAVNKTSNLVKLEVAPKETIAVARPEAKAFILSEGMIDLHSIDFTGDEAQRTGLNDLVAVEGVQFIAIPELMAGVFEREGDLSRGRVGAEMLVMDNAKRQCILDIREYLLKIDPAQVFIDGLEQRTVYEAIPGETFKEIALQEWYHHDTDYTAVHQENKLLQTEEIPEKDKPLVKAWSGLVYRAACENIKDEAIFPVLFAYLTDDLLPFGWSKEEALEELAFETDWDARQIEAGLTRLRELLLSYAHLSKALEPLGWVLRGQYPTTVSPSALWLVLCWDDLLKPILRKTADTGSRQNNGSMLESQQEKEEMQASHLDVSAGTDASLTSSEDTEEWEQFLAFLAMDTTNGDIPTDRSPD